MLRSDLSLHFSKFYFMFCYDLGFFCFGECCFRDPGHRILLAEVIMLYIYLSPPGHT